ncbi:hypothetical protein C8A05DRAFT_35267 [Staphylotrichum tortipilum]|uniref:Letm1 RBD domain-containing protein n=1 Tax=Staphylotrichum tortipilum TaxID=2831512 RepID=A0AAN6MIA2_9PEZI|nr:hypothetical protein C8A05DRAFT_35267 [Staphylotrichum longicolle]
MRHHAVLGRALRANARRLSHYSPADTRPVVHSLSLSKGMTLRSYTSASPNPRHSQSSAARATTNATTTARATPTNATATAESLLPCPVNPPPTTRPPPLNLPAEPSQAAATGTPAPKKFPFANLLAKGVAYITFYKTGVKHILANTRLVRGKPSPTDPPPPPANSRAALHLRLRWLHDVRRLPLFAVLLVVCGELTPFVVLAVPGAVPLTCRIPKQVEQLLGKVEAERKAARARVAVAAAASGTGTVVDTAGILGLRPRAWIPAVVVGKRVRERLALLGIDDGLLIESGGAKALVPEEVRLACTDRGVDVLGRSEKELRGVLERWLKLTDARKLGDEGREDAVERLLNVKDTLWPKA